MSIVNIIQVELFKFLRQSRTYYAIGAIFLIELVVMASAYFQGATLIDLLLDELKASFYFEGTLLNGNLVTYLILNSLWFHLPLILMIIASGILTSEYKDGTLQTVMMQDVTKWQFLTAKYIVAVFFAVSIVLLLAASTFLLAYGFFGKGDLIVYFQGLNFYEQPDAFRRLLGAFATGAMTMVFYSVTSITIAVFCRESMTTWIVSALFLIISTVLVQVDFGSDFVNQFLYVKLNDSWQYNFYKVVPFATIYRNVAVLLLYTMVIAGIGLWRFQKRDIG